MNTDTITGRDRLAFQRERAQLSALHDTWDVCEGLAAAVCERLVTLNLINDAFAFDLDGYTDDQPNRFRGMPRPALQIRLSGVLVELQGAVGQLRDHARQLQREARRMSDAGHLERIGRGFETLAAEGRRVYESYGPYRVEVLPDWRLINRIHDGVRELERRQDVELREDLAATLEAHDQRLVDLRASGRGVLADRLEADPALQRGLRTMRGYVAEAG